MLLVAFSTNAQDMRPADFDHPEADRRMDTLLVFPEIKGDISVVMNCFARVKANGRMEGTSCYLQNNYDEPFARAIGVAGKKARMNPAIVGGRAREIFLQFRVEAQLPSGDLGQAVQFTSHDLLNAGHMSADLFKQRLTMPPSDSCTMAASR